MIAKLNAEANRILQGAEMKEQLAQQGALPVGGTAQEFASRNACETVKWSRVVREAGIRPE